MWAQKDVTVVVDGEAVHVRTQADDVASVLEDARVSVGSGDVVSPSQATVIERGDTVVVRHAVPVTVDVGQGRKRVRVVGETVADALVAAGVDPDDDAGVNAGLDEPLEAGMTIEQPPAFVRVTREEATVTPTTSLKKDPTLPAGERRVLEPGEPGRVVRVFRVIVTDGVESTPTLSSETTVTEPAPRIVAVGTGPRTVLATSSARGYRVPPAPAHGRRMYVEATGYSPREPGLDFTTATGARARHGVIAVDPRVIPLGTRVYVPGYGYAVAADTGGAIKGRRIDLCYDTVAEAILWGRRHVTIIILD